ncbi:MAG: PRC-barrel domain-containing protein [Myxococcales bacterium]
MMMGVNPGVLLSTARSTHTDEPTGDAHLRSARELRGYHLQGSDDSIGHVADFIVDDVTWEVRYLVIDTSNWWLGKKVLVAPRWASHVAWAERKVFVDLSREAIKNSPDWNGEDAINREYETRVYDYYDRGAYWVPSGPPKPKSGRRHSAASK